MKTKLLVATLIPAAFALCLLAQDAEPTPTPTPAPTPIAVQVQSQSELVLVVPDMPVSVVEWIFQYIVQCGMFGFQPEQVAGRSMSNLSITSSGGRATARIVLGQ